MYSINTIVKAGFIAGALAFLVDCGSPDPVVPAINQYPIDSVIIADYINEKGYDHAKLDTAKSVVARFSDVRGEYRSSGPIIYMILDEGDGDSLENDDIVSFYYTLSLVNDSVKLTNNPTVAKENDILGENNEAFFKSVKYTLSNTIATVPTLHDRFMNDSFKVGVLSTMKKLRVGGRARFIVPSTIAFSNYDYSYIISVNGESKTVLIPANSVIVADIYPVFVRKSRTN